MSGAQKKISFFQKILEPVSGTKELKQEKARLEAFLAALPGEYCGFAKDGSAVFSEGFAGFLRLNKIATIEDIQGALCTSDAAALEGQFYDLQHKGKPFSIIVSRDDETMIFRISGTKGEALDGQDSYLILWLEDVTLFEHERQDLRKSRDKAMQEQTRLQSTLDHLPQMMWIRNAQGDIVWCNTAYAEALNLQQREVIAQQKEIAVTKTKGLKPKEMAALALSEGVEKRAQFHAIMNSKRRSISIAETPLPSTQQTLGTAQDITREDELQKEIERYTSANKELLEQLRTAIGMCNPDQKLEFYNSAFAQLWGLEDQWLNTKPKLGEILEKLRESRRLPEQADFRKYKEGWLRLFTDLLDPHEDMLYLPDGSVLRTLMIPNPAGGLILTFEDVTSRIELESSYNTLIAVQRETLDNLAEGVAVFGGDGRLKLFNPAFKTLWAFHPEELDSEPHISTLATKMKRNFPDENWDEQKSFLISLGLDRDVREGRMRTVEDTLVEYATVPLPDGGVLISFYDITDSARVEAALREKNAALETAERVKLDFLANVSYQLRTPLNALMGFNEILDNQYFGDLNDKQREYTTGIHEAGERLMNLINDILDLSTIEAGYMELDHDEFDIQPMMQGLQDLTQDWAGTKDVKVKINCPSNIGVLNADQRRIKQVLLNLIRNAIHHSPIGSTILLKAEPAKHNSLRLSVQDSGKGIAEKHKERVFQPFERINDSEHNQGNTSRGAGLGLALVQNIVNLHHGKVDIESTEGKGTIIVITLPRDCTNIEASAE